MMRTTLLALLSMVLASAGQFLLKIGVDRIGGFSLASSNLKTTLGRLLETHIVCGIALFGLSMVIWLMVISRTELSRAYPMVSFSYALVALLSHFFLGKRFKSGVVEGISGVFPAGSPVGFLLEEAGSEATIVM